MCALKCPPGPTNLRRPWNCLAKLRVKARWLSDLPEGRYFVHLLPPGDPSALLRGYCRRGRTQAVPDHRRYTGLPAGHTTAGTHIPPEKVDIARCTELLRATRSV